MENDCGGLLKKHGKLQSEFNTQDICKEKKPAPVIL